MEKLLIVCGPTASGKTDLALQLAKKFGGELVSADSRQIYRGMDIGTGKDLKSRKTINFLELPVTYDGRTFQVVPFDMDGIPLWMYDVVFPNEEFSVAHYSHLANDVINSIIKRGNIPILVGGTGLYIRSVVHPFETAGIKPDMDLRRRLKDISLVVLQEMVKRENPDVWNGMNVSDRSNPYRLIRKLEITHSAMSSTKPDGEKFEFLSIGLMAPNTKLFERIDIRVEKRMEQGLLDEIEHLKSHGYDWRLQSFNALGYREWRSWFENPKQQSQKNKNLILQEWKFDEHAYARRQMTWFRKDMDITWFDITKPRMEKNIMETVDAWYNAKR
jgi:tRNA dimethylallyltransferase